MNIKEYDMIKSIATFYYKEDSIYYEYNGEIYHLSNLDKLKEELTYPFKISFKNIPIEMVINIIECFDMSDTGLFFYREKKPMTKEISYHVYISNKDKVKKLD